MTDRYWDKQTEHFDKKDELYTMTIEHLTSLLSESDTVLDFGCATGAISMDIALLVQSVYGIDISAKMIERARQKADNQQIKNTHFDQITIFDDRLSSQSFQVIMMFNVLHLLNDLPKTMARVSDLLNSEGLLILQTPCLGERKWLYRLFINPAYKLGLAPYIKNLTRAELEKLVNVAGFEILESMSWNKLTAIQWIVARKIRI